ncbi:LCP family protein required for cell wall assembly [Nakamurella sp. UYEF19]|uniref:LCP family glycopolymer transferase n=1 Tax=Nakamurella sp. UYEF19 TaxID=1756392 RepID=UPI0033945376
MPPAARPQGPPPNRQPSPGRQQPPRLPERQAWSDLADGDPGRDRTAIYPPGALGFDRPIPQGQPVPEGPRGQVPLRGPIPPGRQVPRAQGQRNQGRALDPYRPVPDQEQRRRTPGVILAGRIIAAVLSVAVLAGFALAWGFANNATSRVATGNDTSKAGQAGVLFRGGTNILLIGSDSRTDQQGNPLTAAELAAVSTQADGGSVNTDTIMIVHIPEGGGKATAVSLPRDTWIPKSVTDIVIGPYEDGTRGPYKPNKINSFYSTARFYTQQFEVSKGVKDKPQIERDANNAGRTELQAIIQAFTGLHIDHYAEVNLIGFYTLSNAIGGVPVCLNAAVSDPFSGANFKAGPQEISGSAAMSFVRQRHGLPGGDLDRVRRQQAFLAGATSKMLSAGVLGSPSKLSSLLDAAGRSLVLDSGFDLLTFAAQMADLSGGNVTFSTIPISGTETSTNTDALATDPTQIKAFFSAINGKSATKPGTTAGATSGRATTSSAAASFDPGSVTVDVQNATKINNLAASVSARLAAAGFVAGDVITFPGITAATAHATTTISYPTGAKDAATAVQKALGGKGKLVVDDSISGGHISVAAGQDMPAPSGLRALGLSDLAAGAVTIPLAQAAPATTTGPAPISAATVGCVN